jgi:hypothetical protein
MAGGRTLKVAVKVPNFLILNAASGLTGLMCKKSKKESQADGGGENCLICVEFPAKFSCQLTKSNPSFGLAIH